MIVILPFAVLPYKPIFRNFEFGNPHPSMKTERQPEIESGYPFLVCLPVIKTPLNFLNKYIFLSQSEEFLLYWLGIINQPF